MGIETDFVRLLDSAPKVTCPVCIVQMTLRTLVPTLDSVPDTDLFSATYRCPKCGTDSQREFAPRRCKP